MIIDHISNRESYYHLGEKYKLALDFFASYNEEEPKKEDRFLDEETFVKIRPMMTKKPENASFEAHNLFADIHYVADGIEDIGYALRSDLKEVDADPSKDVVMLEGDGQYLTLTKGWFMITLPQDAHKPAVRVNGEETPLVKLIAKVKV